MPKYLDNALTDFGRQFPVPRNTAASKTGNGVILLL